MIYNPIEACLLLGFKIIFFPSKNVFKSIIDFILINLGWFRLVFLLNSLNLILLEKILAPFFPTHGKHKYSANSLAAGTLYSNPGITPSILLVAIYGIISSKNLSLFT